MIKDLKIGDVIENKSTGNRRKVEYIGDSSEHWVIVGLIPVSNNTYTTGAVFDNICKSDWEVIEQKKPVQEPKDSLDYFRAKMLY